MTPAYISIRRSSGRVNFSVASKINDGLINDDTSLLLDNKIVWTYPFLSGKEDQ